MSVDSSVRSVEKIPPEGLGSCRISVVKSAKQVETTEHQLEDIRNWIVEAKGKFASTIQSIRATSDEEKQSELKRSLPAVMFSGTFRKRSSKELIQHSGLICMDFDHIEKPEEIIDTMRFDPHLALAFVSPRGNGVKAVFCIPQDGDQAAAFDTVRDYCSSMYELEADESGKDVSRLCFLSVDPVAHYEPNAVPLKVAPKIEAPKPKKAATEGERIGDRYEASADVYGRSKEILSGAGWKILPGAGDKTFCTRPGKERGVSGTLFSNGGFYCFSDQAPPLEPSKGYSAFGLYTTLKHGGDFKAAAQSLAEEFGEPLSPSMIGLDFYGKRGDAAGEIQHNSQPTIKRGMRGRPANAKAALQIRPKILIDGLAYVMTKILIGGVAKLGKSLLAANLSAAVARGKPFLGFEAQEPARILYIDFELAEWEIDERLNAISSYDVPDNLSTVSLKAFPELRNRKALLKFVEARIQPEDFDMIVWDCLYKFAGLSDENSNSEMGKIDEWLDKVVNRTHAAQMVIHHFGKGYQGEKNVLDRFRGGSALTGGFDSIISLTAHEEKNAYIVEGVTRSFPDPKPIVARKEYPFFIADTSLDPSKHRKPGKEPKVSHGDLINNVPIGEKNAISAKDFGQRVGYPNQQTAKPKLDNLVADGAIEKVGKNPMRYYRCS